MRKKRYVIEIIDSAGRRDYICVDYLHLVKRISKDLTSSIKRIILTRTTSPGRITIFFKTVKIVESGYYNVIFIRGSHEVLHLIYVDNSQNSGLTKRICGDDGSLAWLLKDVSPAKNLVISQDAVIDIIEKSDKELSFECGNIKGHVDDWVKEKLYELELTDLSFAWASYEGKPFEPWLLHKDNPLLKTSGIRI